MARITGLLGDGFSEIFDINAGFGTAEAVAILRDASSLQEIIGFGLDRETPNPTSVRLTLAPAPALNGVSYSVSDGTEEP
jgi:hypothetical protein